MLLHMHHQVCKVNWTTASFKEIIVLQLRHSLKLECKIIDCSVLVKTGFCYSKVAVLQCLLGTTIPTLSLGHLNLSLTDYLVLHSLVAQTYPYAPRPIVLHWN
jgi:hypothetical protein